MSFPEHSDHISALVKRISLNKKWAAHTIREKRRSDVKTPSEPPYQFTLDLSSMLLMLSITENRRKQFTNNAKYTLDYACSAGWPQLSRDYVCKNREGKLTKGKLKFWHEQINLLRHALAHGNITLNGRKSGVIESFDVCTTRDRKWKATVAAADTSKMVDFLAEHLPKKVAV